MNDTDEYAPIREYVKRNLAERAASKSELSPSKYWTDFARNFRYVYELPRGELQRIRFHTYHLTSDFYLTYYFASEEYKTLLSNGYRFFCGDGKITCVEEGVNGLGVETKFGRISHDLLRYLGVLRDLGNADLVPNSSAIRIAEVGGGYGGLARVIFAHNPKTTYIICDLEETIFFSAVYLANHLGTDKIHLLDHEIGNGELKEGHAYFVPQSRINLLEKIQFDFVINQQSFQEMTQSQVDRYLAWIEAHADHLYSCNIIDHGEIAIEKSLVTNLPEVLAQRFGKPTWQGSTPDQAHRFGDNHLVRAVYRTRVRRSQRED